MHFFGAWLWLRTFYFKEYFPRHERQRKTMKFKKNDDGDFIRGCGAVAYGVL